MPLRDIYKIYPGGVTTATGFCLEIEGRGFIILAGPSGCGESTTLRVIAGPEEISKDELYIGDKLSNDIAPKDRNIAVVFQDYALYPHMTVFDNMAFGLELRKTPKGEIERRMGEAACILDISHLPDGEPKALSDGQHQRVTLGRVIVRDPKVFLLDEPLSNLGVKLRTQMGTEIAKPYKHFGTTFIYVTHDQTKVMTMAGRIAVMKDSFIQRVDTPQSLCERPVNEFMTGSTGSPQMNFLDAVLGKDGARYTLAFGKTTVKVPQSKTEGTSLDEYVGKTITFGIRPEDVRDEPQSLTKSQDSLATMDVEVAELMDAEIYLYLSYEGNSFTARISPAFITELGDKTNIALDMVKCHIFDRDTELTILN